MFTVNIMKKGKRRHSPCSHGQRTRLPRWHPAYSKRHLGTNSRWDPGKTSFVLASQSTRKVPLDIWPNIFSNPVKRVAVRQIISNMLGTALSEAFRLCLFG